MIARRSGVDLNSDVGDGFPELIHTHSQVETVR